MEAFTIAANSLNEKHETLLNLATAATGPDLVRLAVKADGVKFAAKSLQDAADAQNTLEDAMIYAMGLIAKEYASTDKDAYKDGLEVGLETIKIEYLIGCMVEFAR